jgi:hypothetical protein
VKILSEESIKPTLEVQSTLKINPCELIKQPSVTNLPPTTKKFTEDA